HEATTSKVSEDGLTWTFILREDVRWNDGAPFTAEDVVFTFNDLIYNDAVPNSARDVFTIDGQPFEVRKLDDHRVQFILPKPFSPFLRAMSQEILPKHILADVVKEGKFSFHWGIDARPQEIVGTGPFQLDRYSPGERVEFKRNPYYWKRSGEGDELPYLDGIIMMIIQNQDLIVLKFLEGELDYCPVRGMDFPILKPREREGNYTVFEVGADFGTSFIVFNQNRRSNPDTEKPFVEPHKLRWFTDLRFRKAVAHVIDKARMIEIVKNGLGYPQHAAMSPSAGFYYNEHVQTYAYDLARAKKILEDAGYKDRDSDGIIEDDRGIPVEFNLYTNAGNVEREKIAAMIRHDLSLLGMKVNFLGVEFNALIQKLNATYDWDAILLGLTGGVEPHFGRNVWHSSGQLHVWSPMQSEPATDWEARVDRIFDAAVQELDEDKRKILYDEWQRIVSEELPLIYTILGGNIFAVRDRFGNLRPTAYGGAFHNIEEIYIKTHDTRRMTQGVMKGNE
ncbi:MAG TPA: ABC transporter substrate-binding protein, partial [Candidatus Omnitrophota bacterium]|nr:ABC transporter substrate-binding protein [Candidatus Omnitrophota bacterium]